MRNSEMDNGGEKISEHMPIRAWEMFRKKDINNLLKLLETMRDQYQSDDLKKQDAYGNTFLHIVTKFSIKQAMDVLLTDEFKVKLTPEIVNIKNAQGATPLHLAVKFNNIDLAEVLIKMGAKVESKAKDELTPLEVAIGYDMVS